MDYAVQDIYEEDKDRFLEFYDVSTIAERLKERHKDYIVQIFRTKIGEDEYVWQFYILIRMVTKQSVRYLSCVRDMDMQLVDEFLGRYEK